jgi:hypothetical protein
MNHQAPLASQGICYKILVLNLCCFFAEIVSHLVSQTTSTPDTPDKSINNIRERESERFPAIVLRLGFQTT